MKQSRLFVMYVAVGFALIGFIGTRFVGGDAPWTVFSGIAIGMTAYVIVKNEKERRNK